MLFLLEIALFVVFLFCFICLFFAGLAPIFYDDDGIFLMHLIALVLKGSSEIKFIINISSSRSRSSTQQQLQEAPNSSIQQAFLRYDSGTLYLVVLY